MNTHDVVYLNEYNKWANARMLELASKLTSEQFAADLRSSHRSVRDTLAHTLAAEWIWLERWKGTSPEALLTASAFPTIESLRERWTEVEQDYTEFLSGLSEDALEKVIAYTNTRGEQWKYPLGSMIQHLMNHSTYHRGQVTTMLRQLGAEVRPVDLLVFMDAANR
jgi:uncharacterized damage-inducible protein DinB